MAGAVTDRERDALASAGASDPWLLFAQAQVHVSRAARPGEPGVYGPNGEVASCLARSAESALEWGRAVLLESRVPLPAGDRLHRLADTWQMLPRLCRARSRV